MALKELRGTRRALRLIHVITPAHLEIDDELELQEAGRTVLTGLADRLGDLDAAHPDGASGTEILTEVIVGDAGEELAMRAGDAGLLVLGRHGAGTVNSRRIGTVSFGLPGHALSTVLVHTVRDGSEFDDPSRHPSMARGGATGGVVVGLDTSEYAGVAALDAASLAVASGWRLRVLVGVDALGDRAEAEAGPGRPRLAARGLPGPRRGHRVPSGDPAQMLIDASKAADIVVIGKRGKGVFAAMTSQLGRTSSAVLTDAEASVLLVPYRRDPRLSARSA